MKTITDAIKASFYKLRFKHQASIALGTIGAFFFSAPLTGIALLFAYKKEITNSVVENKEKVMLGIATEAVKAKTFGIFNIFTKKK